MKYPIPEKAMQYIDANEQALMDLLCTMAVIPAPSNHEEKRAEFCKQWFEAIGGKDVHIDAALNVVYPINVTADNDVVVFMAHTDVVFPDTEALPLSKDEKRIYNPGIGDDTCNLAVLMMCAKYVTEQKLTPKTGFLFVANAGEEGLGNLKGSRQIMKDYAGRVKEFISFDGYYSGVTNDAVGSHRYKVTVTTEGGHSYGAFGNRNAIAYLASMISTLYDMKVPSEAKTTYNVGIIEGGTSVNTIAQEASMLYEYRSEKRECLTTMEKMFMSVIEAYRNMGIGVEVEVLGVRPCMGDVDEAAMAAFTQRTVDIVEQYYGKTPRTGASSTDANIPLSEGVTANTVGVLLGGKAHTRQEYIEIDSMQVGFKIGMTLILQYFN